MHAQFIFLPPGFRKQPNLSFDQDNYFCVSSAVKAPFAYAEGCIQTLECKPHSLYKEEFLYSRRRKQFFLHTGLHDHLSMCVYACICVLFSVMKLPFITTSIYIHIWNGLTNSVCVLVLDRGPRLSETKTKGAILLKCRLIRLCSTIESCCGVTQYVTDPKGLRLPFIDASFFFFKFPYFIETYLIQI